MQVEWYRMANFIMQAVYLPIHLLFIVKLIKHRQPTPIWRLFILVVAGLWGLIAGRFIETCLHLFWQNNIAYAIAVDVTLVSTTVATASFLFWNLYIAGHDNIAENKPFRTLIYIASIAVCLIIVSNPWHHLFYTELDLLGAKTHGPLFIPCTLTVYGMLFAGLIISIIHIIRYDNDKIKRILVFSMYPILPGVTNIIRSAMKNDTLDFNPIVMSLSILCLYQIVFKKSYAGVITESIESVLNQTRTPIVVYTPQNGEILYKNAAAAYYPDSVIKDSIVKFGTEEKEIEFTYEERSIRATSNLSKEEGKFIATFTDATDVVYQQKCLDEQLEKQDRMLVKLDEQKRNIEAYLEALYSIPDLKEKQEMTQKVQELILESFSKLGKNLELAAESQTMNTEPLEENILITQETITTIRKLVAKLKEVSR